MQGIELSILYKEDFDWKPSKWLATQPGIDYIEVAFARLRRIRELFVDVLAGKTGHADIFVMLDTINEELQAVQPLSHNDVNKMATTFWFFLISADLEHMLACMREQLIAYLPISVKTYELLEKLEAQYAAALNSVREAEVLNETFPYLPDYEVNKRHVLVTRRGIEYNRDSNTLKLLKPKLGGNQ